MRDLTQSQQDMQIYFQHINLAIQGEDSNNECETSENGLPIQQDTYYLRLLEALQNDFPVLYHMLGEEFNDIGRRYIDAYPLHHRSIHWFGKDFVDFLQVAVVDPYDAWLVELARFEWRLIAALHTEEELGISFSAMANIPVVQWPKLQLAMHPSISIVPAKWNIIPMWYAAKKKEWEQPDPLFTPIRILIWRKENRVVFQVLTAEEAFILDAMLAGNNISSIYDLLQAHTDDENIAQRADAILKRFINIGLITAIRFNG